jgi:hypothetical protein
MVIQPKFDGPLYCANGNEAVNGNFFEGLALVQRNGRYGYINREGNHPTADFLPAHEFASKFTNGRALATVFGKEGYFSIDGKFNSFTSPRVKVGWQYSNGLAKVEIDYNKWAYIDNKGEFVTEAIYSSAYDFSDGMAHVTLSENGKRGFINTKGEMTVPEVSKYKNYGTFSEGLCAITFNGKIGFINKLGELVIQPIGDASDYKSPPHFSDGLARIQIKGKDG